ncbi:hypothetical protein [Alicyclobacillus vulcanalis]|uniref:Uncharacterized protein n=1 Tax=Alicyclobacillus vulcanalis TaxID=252246 RepID=A0A1N7MAD3_9BACL|nr:hypothetical protein [Alicyclobacillus vulcanalis]SIS83038.1 hypothetical protein SAMN05421799_1053 [Alicyclobacillus vulcanalis]
MTEPWWPEAPEAAAARFAWITLGVSILGFILCWIPFLGIFFGHVFGVVSLVLAIIALLRPLTPPVARLAAVLSLLVALITIALKAIPVVNLL